MYISTTCQKIATTNTCTQENQCNQRTHTIGRPPSYEQVLLLINILK